MAGNTVTLEFAGDATKLAKAAKQASSSTEDVGRAARDAGADMDKAAAASTDFTTKMGSLGAAVDGIGGAFGDFGSAVQAAADIQSSAATKTGKMERALNDVKQAQQDYNQAIRDQKQAQLDSGQATLDIEQATLDASVAEKDYAKAVKEHGKNSDEAKQAKLDWKQAEQDLKQAQEDGKQATEDGKQATIDAKTAQLDLNDAQKEADPSELQKMADAVNQYAPLLTGLVAVMGLVTAAQWLWNLAQLASPTTWIILAIIALVAIIVLIATKTTWFQDLWKTVWGGIKDAASAVGSWFKDTLWGKWIKGAWDAIKNKASDVWDWMKGLPGKLKTAFEKVNGFIFAPFKAAFNKVASAWNSTVGRLSWTVPSWVPGIGGNTFSAPKLPTFHQGGRVPGAPGTEVMAMLQAGETVTSMAGSVARSPDVIVADLGELGDVLVEIISKAGRRRGGNTQIVLGGRNA